jgi:hypothetical protein
MQGESVAQKPLPAFAHHQPHRSRGSYRVPTPFWSEKMLRQELKVGRIPAKKRAPRRGCGTYRTLKAAIEEA